MHRRKLLKMMAASLAAPLVSSRSLHAASIISGVMAPVLKRGYDSNNTGANLSESTFSQTNVGTGGIRKYFNLPMEGDRVGAEAQVLIVPRVVMADGTTRDIAITCSMNNTVWCYDANDSDDLWMTKVAVPVTGTKAIDAWGINDHWGILSTPVVDQDTGLLYLVAWTDPNGNAATATYQMHVLHLHDGSRACPAVPIVGTSNGQTWGSMMRKQRSSLIMTNVGGRKTIFFACGTVQETSNGAAGWIIAYDVSSNSVSATLALTSGEGAGIWMGGASLCADAAGNLYAVTGNGGFDGVNNFGECVIRVAYSGTALSVVDWWSPYSDSAREGGAVTLAQKQQKGKKLAGVNASTSPEMADPPVNMGSMQGAAGWPDEDVGSGGPLLIPGLNMILACGKDGIAYLVRSNNMGKTMPADFLNPAANFAKLVQQPYWLTYYDPTGTEPQNPVALNFFPSGKTRHMHSTPVYYNSPISGPLIFVWGENSPLRVWRIGTAGLTYLAQGNEIASASVTTGEGGMPGGFMCLSSNGGAAGTSILWATIPYGDANKSVTNGRLLAYDAENFVNGVARVLWDSQAQGITFLYNKFNPPVVSGGHLFVPTYNDGTDVYGLA